GGGGGCRSRNGAPRAAQLLGGVPARGLRLGRQSGALPPPGRGRRGGRVGAGGLAPMSALPARLGSADQGRQGDRPAGRRARRLGLRVAKGADYLRGRQGAPEVVWVSLRLRGGGPGRQS